jgi:hypothetical protein
MRGYELAAWEPFFSVIAAAAATLTGLLFVAVPMLAITVWSQLNHRRRSRYEPLL